MSFFAGLESEDMEINRKNIILLILLGVVCYTGIQYLDMGWLIGVCKPFH